MTFFRKPSHSASIDLAEGKVSLLLPKLAIPAITAQLINVLYNMVDRIFIGHIPGIGADALTGVGLTLPIIMLIAAFSSLIGMGGAPRASIRMGRGNQDAAEEILGNCVAALALMSGILTVIFLFFGRDLLLLFGANADTTLSYAVDYLRIYACGIVFVFFSLGLNIFITSQGFALISMATVTIGALCNIFLDWLFIFVFDMGVAGAALATVLSQGVSVVWILRFLTGKRTILRIRRNHLRLSRSVILPVLALGLSPFIMQSTESLLSVCFNTSLVKYGGDLAVGAMTILASVMQLSTLPLLGLTQGAQPIISFNYGAGNPQRVWKTFRFLLMASLAYTICIWLIVMLCPALLARLFSNHTDLISITSWAMRIYMAASCIFSIQTACQQTFIALGNAKVSIFLALFRKVFVLIPLIYILPLFFQNKVFAVFLAEPIADTLAVTVTSILFYRSFRRTMREMEAGR